MKRIEMERIDNKFQVFEKDIIVDSEILDKILFPSLPLGEYEIRISISRNGFNAKYVGVRISEKISGTVIDKVIYADTIFNNSTVKHTLDNFLVGKYYHSNKDITCILMYDIITDWTYVTGNYPHIYITFLKKLT